MQPAKALNYIPQLTVVKKTCLACNRAINKGRADKKFCNDICRNVYNNQLNSAATNNIRNVNNTLGKNRRVLQRFIAGNTNFKISRDELLTAGFKFEFHTSTKTNKRGQTYYYCYEYGYLALAENSFLIVRDK